MTDTLRTNTLRLRRPIDRPVTVPRQRMAAVTTVRPGTPIANDSTERSVRSDALLQGQNHVSIVHNGETYQLRATRLGKLILTK